MKTLITLLFALALLTGCSKTADQQIVNNTPTNPQNPQLSTKQTCDFGTSDFNLSKRAFLNNGKKPTGGGGGNPPPPPPPPPPPTANVLLVDFDGQVVSGTNWNGGGSFTCSPANLSYAAMDQIVNRMTNDYSPFNVIVTTDEAVYNACTAKRQRVIITESWEWYGQAGGTSFLNTFSAYSNTPCFVFSSLLNYNTKQVGEAASHEAGHTIGLRHQSIYSGNVKTSEYNYGQGAGEIGWAPIMGCGYYQNLSLWHKGPNAVSSSTIQDDVAVIAASLGYKSDDYSNTTSGAASLSTSLDGVVNNASDMDFFSVSLGASKTVTLTPYNIGVNNDAADVDLVVRVYNSSGSLISTIDNVNTLNTSTVLAAGNYYVSVGTISNVNTTTYGMIGKYNISLN